MITKIDKKNKFISTFNPATGFYVRTGVINKEGKDTGVDPFMGDSPSLIDCGIMGVCKNAKLCTVGCYQGKNKKENMSLDTFKNIIDQCKGKTFEIALGGFGSPNEHPDFIEIIKYAKQNNIIPNYTTSGIELTDAQIQATKDNCGAVAVSYYKQPYTYSSIDRFLEAGCKTNIHYVLGNDSIDEVIYRLQNNDFPKGINAVIFLLYKPVGCIKHGNILSVNNPKVKTFFELLDTNRFDFKVGLDACCVPGLINYSKNINLNSATPCDGGSFSMYITSDNFALPCSFDNQKMKYAVDLNKYTIQEAWDSEQFEKFRNYHRYSCKSCKNQNDCKGGCPLVNEINLCERNEREYYEM